MAEDAISLIDKSGINHNSFSRSFYSNFWKDILVLIRSQIHLSLKEQEIQTRNQLLQENIPAFRRE